MTNEKFDELCSIAEAVTIREKKFPAPTVRDIHGLSTVNGATPSGMFSIQVDMRFHDDNSYSRTGTFTLEYASLEKSIENALDIAKKLSGLKYNSQSDTIG